MYLNTRTFPTTGYARVLLFMFISRVLGGTGTGCLFQFTYCDNGIKYKHYIKKIKLGASFSDLEEIANMHV